MSKNFGARMFARIKEAKVNDVLLAIYALFCIGSAIYFGVIGQTRNCLLSVGLTLIAPLFLVIEGFLRIKVPALFAGIVLFVAAGSILGSCYDLYTSVPWFDTLLHTISGFIFPCLGFALLQLFIGLPDTRKKFWACVLFGVLFSLALAVLWELVEYAASEIGGFDMEEDTLITSFGSYYLSGNHNETVSIENITETWIFFGDGEKYIIEGGYLELGLIDTIVDMAVCFAGAMLFLVVEGIDGSFGGKLAKFLIPEVCAKPVGESEPAAEAGEQSA